MKAKDLIKLLQLVNGEEEINLKDDTDGSLDPVVCLYPEEVWVGDNWMYHRYVLSRDERFDAIKAPEEGNDE